MIEVFISAPVAAILRWIAFCAASVIVGVTTYHLMAAEPHDASGNQRLLRMVRISALAVLIVGVGRLAQQALAFASEPSEALAMAAILLGTTWGLAWIAMMGAALLLLLAPRLVGRRPLGRRSAIGSALAVGAIVVAPAFQGHAIGSPDFTAIAVGADVAHLIAAAVWLGTLFVIAAVSLTGADAVPVAVLVRAFSPYALRSAATLGATGIFASWLHVRKLPLLWGSLYGQVLCLKLLLAAGVVAFGAFNWKRLTPQLTTPGGLSRLAATARGELVMATAVLAATAILVATPLPNE